MQGYLSLVLHAHLPFVRHPEHESFLEESWLFEAITEAYIPLLQVLDRWKRDGVAAPLALTLTPTLCAMLRDPLLERRYAQYLDRLIELSEKETHRTVWERPIHEVALLYRDRLNSVREFYGACNGDLVGTFKRAQDESQLEILTSAATHPILPLLADHPPSLRAQVLIARDHYRDCFGRDPVGIWLPECAYDERLDTILKEAGLGWFITETHGILHARPKPQHGIFAPVLTPNGLAAFGRDLASAKQVWSRDEGYPGDPRYRDFYRDIAFDLDLDYLRPYLPAPDRRSFTGMKYFAITGKTKSKAVYSRAAAAAAVDEHASHFLAARMAQLQRAGEIVGRPPIAVAPYDAELFGHWWYEGPEFLDLFVRKAFFDQTAFTFITPSEYLRRHPGQQVCQPAASSWGEEGYSRMWLDTANQWIYPHLQIAQERMSELVGRFSAASPQAGQPDSLQERAVRQAGRELLLAQASDWPFILRTGTSAEYARERIKSHLLRFTRIFEEISGGKIDPVWLGQVEQSDNIFANLDWRYWG
jgi:1,4-alpha-glucan branching enzyme